MNGRMDVYPLLELIEEFYEDPKNQQEFEEWFKNEQLKEVQQAQ